jgi:hypothetical protein
MAIYMGSDGTMVISSGGQVIVSDESRPHPAVRHAEARPDWTCIGCGEPYPCEQGRTQLIAAYGGFTDALAVRGVELMEQAIVDLDEVPPDELWRRFLAWTAPLNAPVVPG